MVYDPGGPNGNYTNGINQNPNNFGGNNCWPYTCIGGGATSPPGQPLWFQTYCPDIPGDAVTLNFQTFAMEFGWDNVYVYNGPVASPYNANGTQFMSPTSFTCGGPPGWCNNTLGPGGWTGAVPPGPFTSTHPSGCLTIAMTSDDIVNYAGWSAIVQCQSAFNSNADCLYALRMYDSFGDGWAGSTITVVINGGSPSTYTVQSGSFDQVLIGVDNGDVVSITYNGAGYFPGDNSWTIDQVGDPYSQYHSAIPAVNGNHTFTVNCAATLPTPPQDCLGAQALCNNNPVTFNNNNVGSVGDLTATSGGCLSNVERPGSWYTFTAGTTANIGFTITPTGATDINYAVWGPFPNAASIPSLCSPSTAPIRCSFATAASTFAATGSYTTGMGSAAYSAPQFAVPGTPYSQTTTGNGWVPGITPALGSVYLLYVSNASLNSTPATITWTSGVIDCIFLPVELLSFDAKPVGDDVEATWVTGSEINSAWFNVQRSTDGAHFENVGRVTAAGHSLSPIDYAFTDRDPLPGLSYYRLEQVDLDGAIEYSKVVPVLFQGRLPKLQVFPNPAQDLLYLTMELTGEGYYDWSVVDGAGRTALRGGAAFSTGTQRQEVPLGRLDAGAYQMILRRGAEEIGRARFVKQ